MKTKPTYIYMLRYVPAKGHPSQWFFSSFAKAYKSAEKLLYTITKKYPKGKVYCRLDGKDVDTYIKMWYWAIKTDQGQHRIRLIQDGIRVEAKTIFTEVQNG